MEGSVRVVSEAARSRAASAVVAPILYPVILAIGLSTSGHSLADYPRLIAAGDLSLVRQSVGWLCVVAYAVVYVPPALTALGAKPYIATSKDWLILPSGKRVKVDDILEISLKRGFWQRYLMVQSKDVIRKFIVTFARDDLSSIKSALQNDPELEGVRIV